ncbi:MULTISPECIES: hypothetical protein [Phyllobacterium]|jgi:hypothetical protein|uniref:Uncharacterized protein n=1 Tax=Phyllobacterium sophorae TaxID=1520277 RepID=A0A2P7BBQ5_9HYPH|nr:MULTISPECIES: hypothetical protein [Phyllobacterium]PSH63907.1 hypothetical protein CU103_12670 [Phyllobacterium sophorae]UXN63267.1 hypothetical protein N8E89_11525 [Phyllobacterium sp. A18/5-2]
MMFMHAMTFLKKLKAPVPRPQKTIVKTTASSVGPLARRVNPDSDGKLRRMRQLVEHNRLI